MTIAEKIKQFENELPQAVKLVAVSKFKPVEDIMAAYNAGQRVFGENRPQELAAKAEVLPKDIEWHFIGHLQTNKLKMVLPYASLIHSIDTIRLLEAVDKAAGASGRHIPCLLEVHISKDETKQGFSFDEVMDLSRHFSDYPNVIFKGVMGMASLTDDMDRVRCEFRSLKNLSERIYAQSPEFCEISMGMSGDYPIAVEEGSTIVRIGSKIFGKRS
ncbi:MAG: YggS family pyridoxal phosphate-dependent enzyme [Bacteroidales bacterium]|nr:YggS family pyridoxal phosphate-dependent enzyme [Candidatus Cacconaster equi]